LPFQAIKFLYGIDCQLTYDCWVRLYFWRLV